MVRNIQLKICHTLFCRCCFVLISNKILLNLQGGALLFTPNLIKCCLLEDKQNQRKFTRGKPCILLQIWQETDLFQSLCKIVGNFAFYLNFTKCCILLQIKEITRGKPCILLQIWQETDLFQSLCKIVENFAFYLNFTKCCILLQIKKSQGVSLAFYSKYDKKLTFSNLFAWETLYFI